MEVDGEGGPHDEGGGPLSSDARLPPSSGKPASFFVSKAEDCLSSFPPKFELAVKYLEKGLSVHPNDVELLQRLAGEYAEMGRRDEAKELLQKAIKLEPSSGPVKFLQLAQLEDGAACLSLYRAAISMLETSLAALSRKQNKTGKGTSAAASAAEEQQIKTDLIRAHCSLAELYLTDLCDEPGAEAAATSAVQSALQLGPDNPEALLCDAQLKKAKDDSEGALSSARCLYTSLKRLHAKAVEQATVYNSMEAELTTEEPEGPSIETRVNAAKLFVDVGMTSRAIKVIKTCLDEDDDDAWLVMCCALFKAEDFDSCLDALDEFRERLKRCEIPEDHYMAVEEKELRELAQKGLNEQEQQEQQQEQQSEEQSQQDDSDSSSSDSSDDES